METRKCYNQSFTPRLPSPSENQTLNICQLPFAYATSEGMHCTGGNDNWSLDEETGTVRASMVEANGWDQGLWWRGSA